MPTPKLTRDILLAALAGFQMDKQRIDTQIAEVQAMLGDGGSTKTAVPQEALRKGMRKKFSVATRRKMALAQRARYARSKGESEQPEAFAPEPAKRKMSAAARKAIGAATKKRWALQKTAEAAKSAQAKKTATKKASPKKAPARVTKKVAPVEAVAETKAPATADVAGQ